MSGNYSGLDLLHLDEICEKQLITIAPNTPVTEAIALMERYHGSCILIEQQDRLTGIFTAQDLVRLIASGEEIDQKAIAQVVTSQPPTLSANTKINLIQLISCLDKHSLSHLPVVNAEGKTIGIITYQSIATALKSTYLFQQQVNRFLAGDYQANSHVRVMKSGCHSWKVKLNRNITSWLNSLHQVYLPPWMGGAIAAIIALAIEFLRQSEIIVPVPFMLLIVTVTLSASLGGIFAGLWSMLVWSLFVIYAATVPFGPATLIGSIPRITIGIFVLGVVALVHGWTKEQNRRLTSMLRFINQNLDCKVQQRTEELSAANIHLKTEIRERQKAEKNLREKQAQLKVSERHFSTLANNAPVGIFRTDVEGKVIYTNPQIQHISGLSLAETEAGKWLELIHPEERELVATGWENSLRNQLPFESKYRLLRSGNRVVWIWERTVPDWNEQGELTGFVGTLTDITTNQQAQEQLQESEAHFFNTLNCFPFPVWISGTDGLCNFFNTAWLDFTGRTLEQELGYGWSQAVHANDLQYCLDKYTSAFEQHQGFQMEYRLRRFDGEYCWLLNAGRPRFKSDGSFAGYVGACVDISDRKRSETEREKLVERIEQERRFLETILQQMPAGVIIAQPPSGKIILSNKCVENILRHPLIPISQMEDYGKYGCLQPNGQPYPPEQYFIVRAYQGEIIKGEEINYCCGDEVTRTLFVNAAPIRDREERIIAGISTFYDISEIKQAREVKKDAENKAVMLKEIHHRIKNNLQIVSTLLDLQSEQTTIPEIHRLLEESQARIQTIALIHEKLHLSETLEQICFLDYVQSLTQYLQNSLIQDKRQIEIILDIEPICLDLEYAIPCGLIINELVLNAFKYGFRSQPEGTITISFQVQNSHLACLTVQDNGVGIQENISLENIQSLGLSLVNSLVTMQLDGTIEIQRVNGTAIAIEFPII